MGCRNNSLVLTWMEILSPGGVLSYLFLGLSERDVIAAWPLGDMLSAGWSVFASSWALDGGKEAVLDAVCRFSLPSLPFQVLRGETNTGK